MKTPLFGRENRSILHETVNRVARNLRIRIRMDEESLLASAEKHTGLRDWGNDDFREPFRVLLASLEQDADPTPVARLLTRRNIVQRLASRLRIEDYRRRNPEVSAVQIPDPIVITGLPRTGTTFLHRLLAQDPENRTLQLWEMTNPVPPPAPDSYGTDPRRVQHRRIYATGLRALFSAAGRNRLKSIHESGPDDPEECLTLLQNSFLCPSFYLHDEVTGYFRWLQNQDPTPAYRYYRLQLQVLLSRFSNQRLIVKSPVHLGWLGAMFEVFPGARILWTHRPLLSTLPSACSHAAFFRGFRSDSFDPGGVGEFRARLSECEIEQACRVRDSGRERSFLDISFRRLTSHPLEVVERIYKFVGASLSQETRGKMEAWIHHQVRQRSHFSHAYSIENFGLSKSLIEGRFASYETRFREFLE